MCPFGAGKRSCPGRKLAEMVVQRMLAKIFYRFDVELIGEAEEEELRTSFNFLLAPADDIRYGVKERGA